MTNTKSFERKSFSPKTPLGQGMRKAAKPFWNAQSAWKNEANSGTCSSPVFCVAKNGPKKNGKQIAVQDDKACATKDSVAKHDDSMHMQLPGTIKFQNNPKKEGKVIGGTSPKVKINGKEAAVIGSQVSTCNDVGAQNNSTVIAPGASMPMPVIVNPLNTEEWKRGQEEKEKKEPKFTSVKWAKTGVDEGKEVELSAGVKDIADGNMVTLQVFREGEGP